MAMRYLIILLIPTLSMGSPLALTRLLVTRVGPCYDSSTAKGVVRVSEMTLIRDMYDSSITGYFNVTEDIPNGWTVMATIQKCQDIRNQDTCDHFKQSKIISNGCVESDEEDIFYMFFHYITPKFQCPVKAGRYKITDYPVFTEDGDLTASESKISTSVFGYTYRLEAFNDDEIRLMCVEASLQLLYIREHDWLGNKKFGLNLTIPSKTPATTKPLDADAQTEGDYVKNRAEDNADADTQMMLHKIHEYDENDDQ